MNNTELNQTGTEQEVKNLTEELMFEELEQRIVPLSGGCATSSSCSCSSSSCIVMA